MKTKEKLIETLDMSPKGGKNLYKIKCAMCPRVFITNIKNKKVHSFDCKIELKRQTALENSRAKKT